MIQSMFGKSLTRLCILIAAMLSQTGESLAGPGDTTVVQTFTFDSVITRRAVFRFPEKGTRYGKILMYYTLKCDSLTPHDKYPCGEWDYTTYARVYHRTGRVDSIRKTQASFLVNGSSPKSFPYSETATYSFYRYYQDAVKHTKTSDYYLKFEGTDYIQVPVKAFRDVDKEVTVSFWLLGDPFRQPMASTLFEGLDSHGRRVVNLHIPYDNGVVYWDAGGHGEDLTDNINKAASPLDYKGKWSHWAVTKNAVTGSQKIFLDGRLFHEGTGLHRTMEDLTTFIIGANGKRNGRFYQGSLDEFAVWDRELTEEQVAKLAYAGPEGILDDNLVLYYSFDEPGGVRDHSGRENHGTAFGYPQFILSGSEPFPVSKPEAGSNLVTDSLENPVLSFILFGDSLQPELPTDTIMAWSAYNYSFDGRGNLIDSSLSENAIEMKRKTYVYYGDPFDVIEPFELGRFITPYGKRLDLGLEGFTWVYDVTDYEPLLHGQVDLQAANGQELLDLRFVFIEGIPPRDVISVRNIWPEGSYKYKDLADDTELKPLLMPLHASAGSFMIRTRISGHGHNGPYNCCEWDPKEHYLDINGQRRFSWRVWRDCGFNPVHPQGGTWQFDRAGWCPGTFVDTYDFELTPFVCPGFQVSVDYAIQPYDLDNGEEGGNFEMAMQLFEYSSPNFRLDAALEDILAPSGRHEYRRLNPVSREALVRIRNAGADTLTELTLTYGLQGGSKSRYTWNGKLGFMESAIVSLPKPSWKGMAEGTIFEVELLKPNGKKDEHPENDRMASAVPAPVILPPEFIIFVKTQGFGRAADNACTITNETGEVVFRHEVYEDTTAYYDPVSLEPGAYEFEFTDTNEDGMIRHWWLWWEDREKVGDNGELKILYPDKNELMDLGYDWAEKRVLRFFVGDPR